MPLSNAERQKRHRARMWKRANPEPADIFRAACLAWIDDVTEEARREGDDEDGSLAARLSALRHEVEADPHHALTFRIALDQHLEGRLRRIKPRMQLVSASPDAARP